MYPQQSRTTHTEQLGNEASVYDWGRAHVHALNPTAARVWQLCDGATSPNAIAAALEREMGIHEADAVVDLTLRQLARIHLLELPVEARGAGPATTRRWLIGRGVAAAMLPAIYSIVAPSPVDAQSLPVAAPTLTSLSPNQGSQGTTVAVTLTGTNFVNGATTVNVNGGGVSAANVVVSSATSLTANLVIDAAATPGARTVTVTTAGGTSGGQTFTINPPPPASMLFNYTGTPQTFSVPVGIVSVTIQAAGAAGAPGTGPLAGPGQLGGQVTATVPVTPGALLTVNVGGAGVSSGFNGGGASTGGGGRGGGASSVHDGGTLLVVGGGGGGGGADAGAGAGPAVGGGSGGAGGGLTANIGTAPVGAIAGGGGGTQIAGGAAGLGVTGFGTNGTAGVAGTGGSGGNHLGAVGGGGGGGGYFGGGGGGGGISTILGGSGGGGGSSFTAAGATAVAHLPGVQGADGFVRISW